MYTSKLCIAWSWLLSHRVSECDEVELLRWWSLSEWLVNWEIDTSTIATSSVGAKMRPFGPSLTRTSTAIECLWRNMDWPYTWTLPFDSGVGPSHDYQVCECAGFFKHRDRQSLTVLTEVHKIFRAIDFSRKLQICSGPHADLGLGR